jgi:hypothetical protein
LVGGAAAGWLSSLLGARYSRIGLGEQGADEKAPSTLSQPASPFQPRADPNDRLARIEQRLEVLSRSAAPDAGPAPLAVDSRSHAHSEEARRAAIKEREDRIARHFRDETDTDWARASGSSFFEDLSPVAAKNGFRITNVDCRTTSCAVVLRWNSFVDAERTWESAFNARVRIGCARDLALVPPPDHTPPYEATMLFECELSRSGASEAAK